LSGPSCVIFTELVVNVVVAFIGASSRLSAQARTIVQSETRAFPDETSALGLGDRTHERGYGGTDRLLLRRDSGGKLSMATPNVSSNAGLDPLEGLTAIILGAAWADGSVLPCEADRLEHTLGALPVFRGQSAEALRATVERVARKTADGDAMTLIAEAAAALRSE
jgi:hypothetical protein